MKSLKVTQVVAAIVEHVGNGKGVASYRPMAATDEAPMPRGQTSLHGRKQGVGPLRPEIVSVGPSATTFPSRQKGSQAQETATASARYSSDGSVTIQSRKASERAKRNASALFTSSFATMLDLLEV